MAISASGTIERRGVMSCYHGSKISGPQQQRVFATATVNSKKNNRFRLAKKNFARASIFFVHFSTTAQLRHETS